MLLKLFLCHVGYDVIWVPVILQMDFDISQELVVFGKHRNDRDFGIIVLDRHNYECS